MAFSSSTTLFSAYLLLFSAVTACNALSSSQSTAPAFIWSNHRSFGLDTQGSVDYHTFTPKTLVDTIMQKFGWSSSLCVSHDENPEAVVAFIGNQLQSEDLSHDTDEDSLSDDLSVRTVLKEVFSSSNYSVALPYVSFPSEGSGIVSMLLTRIQNTCDLKSRSGRMMVMGTCLRQMANPNFPTLDEGLQLAENVGAIKEFIHSRKASRSDRETDIIIACPNSETESGEVNSEGNTLAVILSSLRQSGTSNVVLYASDLVFGNHYDLHRSLLSSNSSSCDEICETVTGVYEGIIVAVTLLIILISGLCCMMGIDTPSRFESSQDS